MNHTSSSNETPVKTILIATLIAAVATFAWAYIANWRVWFPEQASTVAPHIDLVFNVITWISIFFFVQILVVMGWFIYRYHTGREPKATSDLTHNTPLELTWTIIPMILVIAIFYVGLQGYLNLRIPPVGTYDIRVTAQKWSWSFEHSNGASESGVLAVPLNKPVKLTMTSQDVTHALYVPSFRIKQDVVPGRFTTLWFEATKEGEFPLFCAEYCGKDHSQMRATVLVMPEAKFRAYIKDVADLHKKLPDSKLAAYGLEKIYPRCASCHSLDGKDGTGPSWRKTHELWGQKDARVFADGSKTTIDENYIRDSILDPGKHIVANFTNAMPTFKGQLDDRQILAMILAIKNLDLFDNNGKLKAGEEDKIDWHMPKDFPGSSPAGPPGSGATTAKPAEAATMPTTPNPNPGAASGNH